MDPKDSFIKGLYYTYEIEMDPKDSFIKGLYYTYEIDIWPHCIAVNACQKNDVAYMGARKLYFGACE